MLFTLVKQDDIYQVQENGHLIYTIVQEKEGNLINILLKNPYEDVVLSNQKMVSYSASIEIT